MQARAKGQQAQQRQQSDEDHHHHAALAPQIGVGPFADGLSHADHLGFTLVLPHEAAVEEHRKDQRREGAGRGQEIGRRQGRGQQPGGSNGKKRHEQLQARIKRQYNMRRQAR